VDKLKKKPMYYTLNIDQVTEHSVPVTQIFWMVVTWFCKWQEFKCVKIQRHAPQISVC